MNLAIDVGNSFTKAGLFENNSLTEKSVFNSTEDLRTFLLKTPVKNVIFSSVSWAIENIASSISSNGRILVLQPGMSLPIQNKYETPGSLGVDRLASACGAWSLFPHQNCLVVDAGTCINYEFVNHQGEYRGGAISPGVKIRFESMHHYASKLPLAPAVDVAPLTGNNTLTSLQSGVMNGVLEEIKGVIRRYQIQNPDIRVILCGGDAHFFENDLKPSIFVAPELVLMGLNSILLHNVNP